MKVALETVAAYVQLLGQPRIKVGATQVLFVPDKRYQLLAYLAYHGDWLSREKIAFLFWPDTDTHNAKQNLRGLLHRVRAIPWLSGLEADTHKLRWLVETDLRVFHRVVEEGKLEQALSLYAGSLLQDTESDDVPEYSDWLEVEREHLHTSWRDILLRQVEAYRFHERFPEAAKLLQGLLGADKLDEDALRLYMEVTTEAGRADWALSAYRSFATHLKENLDLEPTSGLQRLASSIADGRHAAGHKPAVSEPAQLVAPVGLPSATSSFIGRSQEIHEVMQRLAQPDCFLLTLSGAGGIGKTRLALQAAQMLEERYSDGICFVPLDTITTPAEVPTALVSALGLPLARNEVSLQRITQHLADKQTLLVLDNFEQLLEGADLVATLLQHCPKLKLLITSRERLNLQEEWLYPLDGLAYPPKQLPLEQALAFDAVKLFVARAERVKPDFRVTDAELPHVLRICELAAGYPLALELAAVWVRAMPLEEIQVEIRKDLGFLSSSANNRPERHRSMQAAFEHSWRLLSPHEQTLLRNLSVFRSSFRKEAATVVAGASYATLASLVDKSLLRLGHDGRFDLHPLLRQYAQEKQAAHPREAREVQERYRLYHHHLITQWQRDKKLVSALDNEINNILDAAAVAYTSDDARVFVGILQVLSAHGGYYAARGHSTQSLDLLQRAIQAAQDIGAYEAAQDLLANLGNTYMNAIGDLDKAFEAYQHALELAQTAGNMSRTAIFLSTCGQVRFRQGQEDAEAYLERAYQLARQQGDPVSLSLVLEHRGYVLTFKEQWEAANSLFSEALEVLKRLEATQEVALPEVQRRRFFALLNLGETEYRLQRTEAAINMRSEALNLAKDCDNQLWTAHALLELGEMHHALGDRAEAHNCLQQALELYGKNQVSAYVERVSSFMQTHGYHTSTVLMDNLAEV